MTDLSVVDNYKGLNTGLVIVLNIIKIFPDLNFLDDKEVNLKAQIEFLLKNTDKLSESQLGETALKQVNHLHSNFS